MAIAIGFGLTEQEAEEAEDALFTELVASVFGEDDAGYFTDEMVEAIRESLKLRAEASQKQAADYRAADNPPHRYYSFYANVVAGASDVIAIVNFHHINRRHPLAPDGWALMRSRRLFHVDSLDLQRALVAA